jgi:hypothetical protein
VSAYYQYLDAAYYYICVSLWYYISQRRGGLQSLAKVGEVPEESVKDGEPQEGDEEKYGAPSGRAPATVVEHTGKDAEAKEVLLCSVYLLYW